jgi:hypothetical protein
MIIWQSTFGGFQAGGYLQGWNIEISSKLFSRTKFKVVYTLDAVSLKYMFKSDSQNYSIIEKHCQNIMQGRKFIEYAEIDTCLRWPKTISDNNITNEATIHAVAHLNYALKDAITYLKGKGIKVL